MAIITTPEHEVNSCKNYDCKLEKIEPYLRAFISARVFNETDSKDVLQETFLKLHQQREKYNPSKNFYNWALTIAKFQIMGYQTKYNRNRVFLCNEIADTMPSEEPKDFKTEEMQRKALIHCIQNMPPHMKTIAFLRFRRSLPMKQISKIVSRPVGSVSATLTRIRDHIHRSIHEKYNMIESQNEELLNN